MKKIYLILFLFLFLFKSTTGFCTTYTVTGGFYFFSPAAINACVGDTVLFNLASFHCPLEVTLATWNANGNTSNGGFNQGPGMSILVLTQMKTYSIICQKERVRLKRKHLFPPILSSPTVNSFMITS